MRATTVALATACTLIVACQRRDVEKRPDVSAASEDRTNEVQALPPIALRNWKLHVDEFAALDEAHEPGQARPVLRSFDTSIGGNFAWRERTIDYGRWSLPPALLQRLTALVSSAEFAALRDGADQRGPRMQITLAWPGGQRVMTLDLVASLRQFADDAVAAQRAAMQASLPAWSLSVTGPLLAARETIEITSSGLIAVKNASGAPVARGQVDPVMLGKLAHLLTLPRLREAPARVAAATTVPTSFHFQIALTPALDVQIDSGLQPSLAELGALWSLVVGVRLSLVQSH